MELTKEQALQIVLTGPVLYGMLRGLEFDADRPYIQEQRTAEKRVYGKYLT